ncbi:unnamed protein product [Gadus morhua 'NCC']
MEFKANYMAVGVPGTRGTLPCCGEQLRDPDPSHHRGAFAAFGLMTVAIGTDYWLYSRAMICNSTANVSGDDPHNKDKKDPGALTHSGLWRICCLEGVKRGVCSQINHFPEGIADFDHDGAEYVLQHTHAMLRRQATAFLPTAPVFRPAPADPSRSGTSPGLGGGGKKFGCLPLGVPLSRVHLGVPLPNPQSRLARRRWRLATISLTRVPRPQVAGLCPPCRPVVPRHLYQLHNCFSKGRGHGPAVGPA